MIQYCENCGSDDLVYEVMFNADQQIFIDIAYCNECKHEHVLGQVE